MSDNWFGHGTFKRFLHAAVPEGELSGDRQVYLLPAGSAAGASHTERADDDADPFVTPADESSTIPDEARRLRRIDRGFPLVETTEWRRIYEHLAEAWRRVGAGPPSTRMVNQLTRSARDRARTTGSPLTRRQPRQRRPVAPRLTARHLLRGALPVVVVAPGRRRRFSPVGAST